MVDALARGWRKIDERSANDKPRPIPGYHGHQRAPGTPVATAGNGR